MAILNKGNTFADGDQVTSTKLNNLVDAATFKTGAGEAVDGTTLLVDAGGYLKVGTVQTGNIAASAITTAKLADSTGASDGVTTGKLATSAVTTAKIADNAVTVAKISKGNGTYPVQIQQAVKSDIQSIAGAVSTWVDVTGLSLTLTRSDTADTGKVRVQASIACSSNNAEHGVAFRIVRASTDVGLGDADGSRVRATAVGGFSGAYSHQPVAIDFIDDHGLTAATIAYKIQAKTYSPVTGYINRSYLDPDAADYTFRTISTLTVTELV